MTYKVVLSRQAESYFKRLDKPTKDRLRAIFAALENDPFPKDAQALVGDWQGYYRIRVGDYRLVYEVHDGILEVFVFRIGPRGDVY